MRTLLLCLVLAATAVAQINPLRPYFGTGAALMPQTASAATPAPTINSPLTQTATSAVQMQTTVNVATLPGLTIGVGATWNRGQQNAAATDVTVAIRLSATSNIYSWTDVMTPVVLHNATGAPIASTVTTGAGWVVAQNKTGSVNVVLIGQAGFTVSTAGTSPAFMGSIGVPVKLGSAGMYVMPYFKAGSPTLGTNGAVASFILQPGIQFMYGMGK